MNILLDLRMVSLDETRRQGNQRFSKPISRFNLIYFRCTKVFGELVEKSHIASRKTINGLPVIPYTIQFSWRIPLSQCFQKVIAVYGYILKFIHDDIVVFNRA